MKLTKVDGLSPRERRFLQLVVGGSTIAAAYLTIKPSVKGGSARTLGCRLMRHLLSKVDFRELLIDSTVHLLGAGETVFERLDYTDTFFSIVSGGVQVKGEEDQRIRLGAGTFFAAPVAPGSRMRDASTRIRNPGLPNPRGGRRRTEGVRRGKNPDGFTDNLLGAVEGLIPRHRPPRAQRKSRTRVRTPWAAHGRLHRSPPRGCPFFR